MKSIHLGHGPRRLAVALAAVLVTAACGNTPNPPPHARADRSAQYDGGIGQLVRYCEKLRDEGDLVTAAGLCERAHRLDPGNPLPLMRLGGILTQMGELSLAAEAYRTILKNAPEHVEARYELGKTYVALKQYDLALGEFQAALSRRPDDPRLHNAVGVANGLLGAHDAAEGVFRAGLKVAPEDVHLRSNLGLSLVLSGHYDEGLKLLEAVAAGPGAGRVGRENLQLAQGLATAAKADRALAEAEGAPDPEARDWPGLQPQSRLLASAEEAVAASDSDRPVYDRPLGAGVAPTASLGPGAPEPTAEPTMLTEALAPPPSVGPQAQATARHSARPPAGEVDRPDAAGPVVVSRLVPPTSPPARRPDRAASATAPKPKPAIDSGIAVAARPSPTSDAPETNATTDSYAIQFASYTNEERAWKGWTELQAGAGDLLRDVRSVVHRVELGEERGTFYRLRTPGRSKDEAERLCGALKRRAIDCLVVKLEPGATEGVVIESPGALSEPSAAEPMDEPAPEAGEEPAPEDLTHEAPDEAIEEHAEESVDGGPDERPTSM